MKVMTSSRWSWPGVKTAALWSRLVAADVAAAGLPPGVKADLKGLRFFFRSDSKPSLKVSDAFVASATAWLSRRLLAEWADLAARWLGLLFRLQVFIS